MSSDDGLSRRQSSDSGRRAHEGQPAPESRSTRPSSTHQSELAAAGAGVLTATDPPGVPALGMGELHSFLEDITREMEELERRAPYATASRPSSRQPQPPSHTGPPHQHRGSRSSRPPRPPSSSTSTASRPRARPLYSVPTRRVPYDLRAESDGVENPLASSTESSSSYLSASTSSTAGHHSHPHLHPHLHPNLNLSGSIGFSGVGGLTQPSPTSILLTPNAMSGGPGSPVFGGGVGVPASGSSSTVDTDAAPGSSAAGGTGGGAAPPGSYTTSRRRRMMRQLMADNDRLQKNLDRMQGELDTMRVENEQLRERVEEGEEQGRGVRSDLLEISNEKDNLTRECQQLRRQIRESAEREMRLNAKVRELMQRIEVDRSQSAKKRRSGGGGSRGGFLSSVESSIDSHHLAFSSVPTSRGLGKFSTLKGRDDVYPHLPIPKWTRVEFALWLKDIGLSQGSRPETDLICVESLDHLEWIVETESLQPFAGSTSRGSSGGGGGGGGGGSGGGRTSSSSSGSSKRRRVVERHGRGGRSSTKTPRRRGSSKRRSTGSGSGSSGSSVGGGGSSSSPSSSAASSASSSSASSASSEKRSSRSGERGRGSVGSVVSRYAPVLRFFASERARKIFLLNGRKLLQIVRESEAGLKSESLGDASPFATTPRFDPRWSLVVWKLSRKSDFVIVEESKIVRVANALSTEGRIREVLASSPRTQLKSIQIVVVNASLSGGSIEECFRSVVVGDSTRTTREEEGEVDEPAVSRRTRRLSFLGQGPFYTAVVSGGWLLGFGAGSSLVVPLKVDLSRSRSVGIVEVARLSYKDWKFRLSHVARAVVEWNTLRKYSMKSYNCQRFVDDAVAALQVDSSSYSPLFQQFLDRIALDGFSDAIPLELREIKEWSPEDCLHWLRQIHCEFMSDLFMKYALDGTALLGLSLNAPMMLELQDARLKKMFQVYLLNIQKNVHRREIFRFQPEFALVTQKLFENEEDLRNLGVEQLEKYGTVLSHIDYFKEAAIPITDEFRDELKRSGRIKVKLIVTEIPASPKVQLMNKMMSKLLSVVDFFKQSDFGIFHSALLIGNWYLEWTTTEVVIPKQIKSTNAILSFDIAPLELETRGEDFDSVSDDEIQSQLLDIQHKVASVVIEWNTKFRYTRRRRPTSGNCQHFVDEILKKLNLSKKLDLKGSSVFSRYLQKIRSRGSAEMYLEPSAEFVRFFDLPRAPIYNRFIVARHGTGHPPDYRFVFPTHRSLDKFLQFLFRKDEITMNREKFEKRFPSESKLLKSFDRAFWLRHWKSPRDPKFAPLDATHRITFGTFRPTGCPFLDPHDSGSVLDVSGAAAASSQAGPRQRRPAPIAVPPRESGEVVEEVDPTEELVRGLDARARANSGNDDFPTLVVDTSGSGRLERRFGAGEIDEAGPSMEWDQEDEVRDGGDL